MVVNKIWGRVVILVFVVILISLGIAGYFYFVKHKEPTHGVLVKNNQIQKEGVVVGHLCKSS